MKRIIFLFSFLLIFISMKSAHYEASSEEDISSVITSLKAGDTLSIAEGDFFASRIYAIRGNGTPELPIVIRGKGMSKTNLHATKSSNGKCLRLFGNYIIVEHLSIIGSLDPITQQGGGDPLEVPGHNNTIRFVSAERANIGIKISGDNITLHDIAVISCQKTGIEVNGGFRYFAGWSPYAIRIRQAIGKLPLKNGMTEEKNAENRAKWTPEQLVILDSLWGKRDMNLVMKRMFLFDNGYNRYNNPDNPSRHHPEGWRYGQALYGGGIKMVPNVGGKNGVKIDSVLIYKNGFSGFWADEPAEGKIEINHCVAIDVHQGVHIEIGLNIDKHQTTVKNSIFWNVHQGIFNSASGRNIYKNNIINSFKYGMVNHGMKGNRIGRPTIAEYANNKVYLEPFVRNRVGDYKYEEPLGHLVWFSGPDAEGSTRSGNVYYTTPSFPQVKIANSTDEGYSFAPGQLGQMINGEKQVSIDSVPDLSLDSWWLELPLLTKYFDRTDITFGGQVITTPIDSPIIDPIDTVIVDPPDTTSNPPTGPPAYDSSKVDIAITSDFYDDPDDVEALALAATLLDKYNLRLIIGGTTKRGVEGKQEFFDNEFHPAYKQAQPALNAIYGNFPEELPFIMSDLNGIGFKDENILPSSTRKLYDLIPEKFGEYLYIFWWGHSSEVAQLTRWLVENDPDKLDNIIIIAHAASETTHNNYRGDKAGSLYVNELAKQGRIILYHFGFSGKLLDGKAYSPLVKISDHGTALGKLTTYKHKLKGGPKTDASDFITVLLSVIEGPEPPFYGGLSYLNELEKGVTKSNENKIISQFANGRNSEIRISFFPYISDRYKEVANWDGTVIVDPPDPPNGDETIEIKKDLLEGILKQVGELKKDILILESELIQLIYKK